uniref:COP9 signalosome complex subunit 2 n=1 Tax=Caenorhabditis tropicalis TaxID=1561998 RepID=A0A1I7TCM9_9PELO
MPDLKGNIRMLNYDYEDKKHLFYWPESVRFKDTFAKFFSSFDLDLNQRGLVWFIKKGLLEAALNGTSDMLTWLGQGKDKAGRPSELTQITMEIWTLRFQLLLNLRMHAQLLAELAAFEELDAPDLFHQYKSADKTGSLVPFAMRIIHAEALRFSPFPWKSLIRIESLQSKVEKIVNIFRIQGAQTNHVEDWEKRLDCVKYLYVRVLHELGEYKISIRMLDKVRQETRNQQEKIILTRALMRMAMQAGDEKAMNHFAEKANNLSSTSNEMIIHKAMRSIFSGSNGHANEYISRIPEADDNTPQYINTKAMVQLYTGRAVEAVKTVTRIKPIIPGPTTTNLKTIAELCYSTAAKDELLIR